MVIQKGGNPNSLPKGSSKKVYPIRDKKQIKRIKKILEDNPRDLCLFTLGINTAFRANELSSIKVTQVKHLNEGDILDLKTSKTKKYRPVVLNGTAIESIKDWIEQGNLSDDDYLFKSQRRETLSVPAIHLKVKQWCEGAGGRENYGSHSLRKTWGCWQFKENNTPLPILMSAFRHATQQQTLDYLCIQDEQVSSIYSMEL